MDKKFEFTVEERAEALRLYGELRDRVGDFVDPNEERKLRSHLLNLMEKNQVHRDVFGLNPIVTSLQTAQILVSETGLKHDAVLAVLLRYSVEQQLMTIDEVGQEYGLAAARILHGLQRIQELYKKNPVVQSENFRNRRLPRTCVSSSS